LQTTPWIASEAVHQDAGESMQTRIRFFIYAWLEANAKDGLKNMLRSPIGASTRSLFWIKTLRRIELTVRLAPDPVSPNVAPINHGHGHKQRTERSLERTRKTIRTGHRPSLLVTLATRTRRSAKTNALPA
jgi:hypothetical protein